MKKVLPIILLLCGMQMAFAQKNDMHSSKYSFGLSFDVLDQYTPMVDGWQLFRSPMDYGMRIYSWINVNSSLSVEVGLGTNALRGGDNGLSTGPNLHMLNIDAGLVYKFNNGYILKESAPVSPFLFAKTRASFLDLKKSLISSGTRWALGIPVGGGLSFRVGDAAVLQTSVAYSFGVTDGFDNDLIYSMGMLFNLGDGQTRNDRDGDGVKDDVDICPDTPGLKELNGCNDSDGDGITDNVDDCPDVAGLPSTNGCPDQDGDGIRDGVDDCPDLAGIPALSGCPDADGDGVTDADDNCPDVAGIRALDGCPDQDGDGAADGDDDCPEIAGTEDRNGCPDKDGDGVLDGEDDCPELAGLANLKGCPDADGDGVIDPKDSCPDEAGPATNKGCPEIEEEVIEKLEFAATNIQFETGSAVIKTASFPILNEVVDILKDYDNYNVSIEGHTDNVGSEASNLKLSEKRAQAAAAYLISKGIPASRVSSKGFGESQPKGDNSNAGGRAMNRRVEFNLFLP